MTKKLTPKERKLVEAKAKGKTHIEAANAANYLPNGSTNTRQVEVARTLNKPHVKEALDIALRRHDITLDKALAPIAKGLQAKKVVSVEGDFYQTDVDDLDMQLKASDRALKLMGVHNNSENATQNFIQIINEKGSKYND